MYLLKFFRDLPSQDDDGQVLPISSLWNTAMAHPKTAISSTTVSSSACPLSSTRLLRGRLTWYVDRRLSYHCDLLTRGMGGVEMESRKAEEWANQLQCWSLQLINCFAFKPEFLHDPSTCHKKPEITQVSEKVVPVLIDLSEITTLGDHKKFGDSIVDALEEYIQLGPTNRTSTNSRTRDEIENLLASRQRLKREKNMPKEDPHQAHSRPSRQARGELPLLDWRHFWGRLQIFRGVDSLPNAVKGESSLVYDATRALWLHSPVNRHARSLWRRAQAYDMLGFAKESLLDAILFINEFSQSNDPDLSSRQNKVPGYAERLVKKQMRAAWLFIEAAVKHGVMVGVGRRVMMTRSGKQGVRVMWGLMMERMMMMSWVTRISKGTRAIVVKLR
ncbi:hypothetical protein CASFOL_017192 [Castilleja foliolosa]|uniref:ARM repeat N-terminal plant domain-containing protein n=1 Tax=Castilleja foliolosa TaxID=1961234 RepID=A0ABD3DAC7_9LAMI